MVDEALEDVSPLFAALYAKTGRPSIPPERLLRALTFTAAAYNMVWMRNLCAA